MSIFSTKNVDFGDQKRKWTDQSINNNNSMSASIYSVDNLCKRFGQSKVQKILALFILIWIQTIYSLMLFLSFKKIWSNWK